MRRISFSKTKLVGGLALWLGWAASSSRKLTEWPVWTFCPIVLQLAWCFSFSACLARVQLLAACKPRATCEIQSWVPATLQKLEHFFTLSHTLPLHDSHLNTGLLIARIQANLARNKANKMVDKIQSYSLPFWLFRDKTLKQTLNLTCELGIVEHNSLTPNSRNCEALESYEHKSPKTQHYTMIIVCRKAWKAYEAGMMWSSKDGVKKQTMAWSNKQSL